MTKNKPYEFEATIKEATRTEEKGKVVLDLKPSAVAKMPMGEVRMTVIIKQPSLLPEENKDDE